MTPYFEDAESGIVIYHGDCREVLPEIENVDLVLTDPPYGCNFDTDYTRFSGGKLKADGSEKPRYHYSRIEEDDSAFDPSWLLLYASNIILFGYNHFASTLPPGSLLVWDKRTPSGSKGVMSDAEVAWWSQGRGIYLFSHSWDGFNRASERRTNHHPTQKPVALMRWCLDKASPIGLVLDPYAGSGPVGVACKERGLACVLIEIEERYCEIAARRVMATPRSLFAEPAPAPVQTVLAL